MEHCSDRDIPAAWPPPDRGRMGRWHGDVPVRSGVGRGPPPLPSAERRRSTAPAQAAEAAFASYGWSRRDERAAFLEAIADAIEARGSGHHRYWHARDGTSRGNGLRASAGVPRASCVCSPATSAMAPISTGAVTPHCRTASPRRGPDIRLVQRPIGPVGRVWRIELPARLLDGGRRTTASALAAGCPVVVKGHPAHPGTAEIVAEAILEAIKADRPACGRLLADPVEHQRGRRGAGEASSDQGHRLLPARCAAGGHCSTSRSPARSRSRSMASSVRSIRSSCCRGQRTRARPVSAATGPAR